MNNNPFLKPLFNPAEPYIQQKQVQDKIQLEGQRLMYEAYLATANGKKLVDYIVEHFLVPQRIDPNNPQFQTLAVYSEGFKAGLQYPILQAKQHQKRIQGVL